MTGKKKAILAARCLDGKKASDIVVLEVTALSSIADYFVIATADSKRQIKTCADYIDETLAQKGIRSHHLEGMANLEWVLMDYGDIIVHIFDKDSRLYYGLERLWGDAPNIEFKARSRTTVKRRVRKDTAEEQI
ncbi:MAG: ribosome silencing factor [Nitrospirae bacterium]|nr:ribosome silencing factor [Nitrospirota bacterium]